MSTSLEERLYNLKIKTKVKKDRKISQFSHIEPADVEKYLEEGYKMPEIAEIYGCCAGTVSRQAKIKDPSFDARVIVKMGRSDISVEEIANIYRKTKSCTKIARDYGVNTHAITERLDKAGINRRTQYREDISVEDVLKAYKIMKSCTKVANLFNTNIGTIRRRLDKGGITYQEIMRNANKAKKVKIRLTHITKEDCERLYAKLGSVEKVAKKYKVAPATIWRRLRS
tara:strand:- start:10312 stop:10992 length:681 start_codon:yes stop_codon:yes gene_type:complete